MKINAHIQTSYGKHRLVGPTVATVYLLCYTEYLKPNCWFDLQPPKKRGVLQINAF